MTRQTPALYKLVQGIYTEMTEQFQERTDSVMNIIVCALSSSHAFILGEPGTGKSAMVSEFSKHITGAQYFDILFESQLSKEELFGPLDIGLFERSQYTRWERDMEGYLPTADFVFGDEVGNAAKGQMNLLNWAMNERRVRNGRQVLDIPLISFFGASNDFIDPSLRAIWDRFLLRWKVNAIAEPAAFAKMLLAEEPTSRTTISLDALRKVIQVEVPSVTLPDDIVDAVIQLRADLRSESIRPSDRRFKQSKRVLQACAWFNGRSEVDSDDLAILQHVLWETEEQIQPVFKKVMGYTSPATREAIRILALLEEIDTNVRAMSGQSLNDRARFGADNQHKLNTLKAELQEHISTAVIKRRSTVYVDSVMKYLDSILVNMYHTCMNIPLERARKMVEGKNK